MPRSDAQAATKDLITLATAQDKSLESVARAAHPALPADLFDPRAQMGTAPAQARAFAQRVATL